jgi:hypothetical protein
LSLADLIKLGVSALAVALMVGLAAWARIARPMPPLDAQRAKALLSEDYPDTPVAHLWLAEDGQGAIARSGDLALILSRLGDGYVTRNVPWSRVAQASMRDGRLRIPLGDVAAPRAALRMASWPPKDMAEGLAG